MKLVFSLVQDTAAGTTSNLRREAGEREMTTTEKFTVAGNELIDKIKQLIHEGNIRRVRLLYEGRVVLELPLSIGAPAAAIAILHAPVLAALGAFAALVTQCTIEVEKVEKPK
ncbi:MAG: DUF4342 domain-containing protein [Dehalococcoidales bacterium]|nr:DUF4342 domain-containing protein [Dehalococcoidales bacterium]